MGFDSGSVSFRVYRLKQRYTRDIISAFASRAAPGIDSLGAAPALGWVTGRHLLDREVTEEHCILGAHLHVVLLRAEKKIPASLLRAYCRLEEDVERRARQVEALPRAVRAEVKARVTAQLQPGMPPTLTGLPLVMDFREGLLYAGAVSDRQVDTLTAFFRETTGEMPQLLSAERIALATRGVNANDLDPAVFSPDEGVAPDAVTDLGLEFLTWLWFAFERDGGELPRRNGVQAGFLVEGPLVFYREGQGAHEAVLRKGSPLMSREAGTALLCGKKLKRLRLTVQQGDRPVSATFDADFGVRAAKPAPTTQPDPTGRFAERMQDLAVCWQTWLELFDRFLEVRAEAKAWKKTTAEIRAWAAKRAAG